VKKNVVAFPSSRPRTFTSAEAMLDRVRERVFACGLSYKLLAEKAGVSNSTIASLASGKTRWPRPTTLFPLIDVLGLRLELVDK
jgi:transcriptional regulator with XRE-family HTH domain